MSEKILYKSKYLENVYYQDLSLICSYWSSPMAIGDAKAKDLIRIHFDSIKNYPVRRFLLNIVQTQYAISIEMQQWISETFGHIYEDMKIEKYAIIVSADMAVSLSVEQMVEENPPLATFVCYFEEEQKALDWLLH